MKRYAFQFNMDACIGCKACVAACNDSHGLQIDTSRRHVVRFAHGEWVDGVPKNVFSYALSVSCHHCENPICRKNCPQGAIIKEKNGLVYIDSGKCVGCGICVRSCPHGAIQLVQGRADKCDGCRDALNQGRTPACVLACPMRCLQLEYQSEAMHSHRNVIPYKGIADEKPSTMIVPHRMMQGIDLMPVIRSMEEEV